METVGVMSVSAGHYEATRPLTPTKAATFCPSPQGMEGGVEPCLPGERSAGGGARERAPGGRQWGQVALLQLFHQLFLCQATCWGAGKRVGVRKQEKGCRAREKVKCKGCGREKRCRGRGTGVGN